VEEYVSDNAGNGKFEPRLVGFLCRWCSYNGADLAGTSRMKYPPNMVPIRVMCSGRIEPAFVLKAFAEGADGVMILGCHPGDCHYAEGNYKTMRRFPLLKMALMQLGIEEDRIYLDWVSAAEGEKFASVVKTMIEKVRKLGPLNFSGSGRKLLGPTPAPESEPIPEAVGAAK
jgi:F420-non-reducing hydrogenase iron-sulfur subunit